MATILNCAKYLKKVSANVSGLGYSNDLEELKKKIREDPITPGHHHINTQIRILSNPSELFSPSIEPETKTMTCLSNLINKLR